MLVKILFPLTLAVATVLDAPPNVLAARTDPDDSLYYMPGCEYCIQNSPAAPATALYFTPKLPPAISTFMRDPKSRLS